MAWLPAWPWRWVQSKRGSSASVRAVRRRVDGAVEQQPARLQLALGVKPRRARSAKGRGGRG